MTIIEKLQDEVQTLQQQNRTMLWELAMTTHKTTEHSNKMLMFANINQIAAFEKAMEIVCAHNGEPVEPAKCPNEKH